LIAILLIAMYALSWINLKTCIVKYLANTYQNHIYINKLLSSIPTIYKDKIMNLLNHDWKLSMYIIKKKILKLLDLPIVTLIGKTYNELVKIYKIMDKCNISIKDVLTLIENCNLDKVTIYNIKDIIRYLNEYNYLIDGKISINWGPGNNKDIQDNILNHYNKHILSEEGKNWITSNNKTLDWYTNFPLENFTKMEKIVIHTDGKKTYLSGFYGKIFIVGRYCGDKFGISSSYYVPDGEKKGRYANSCIKLSY
jgi:hypothetical protein